MIFQGGSRTPCPPLDPQLAAIYLVSQSAKWCDRLLHMCLFSCNFVVCFQSTPRDKIVSWTYCMTVAWFIQHLLQLVFAFFNHSIKISRPSFLNFFLLGSFLFLSKPFWQMMLFVTNVNEWRHIRWRNYRTHMFRFFQLSLCKNEILVSKM